MRAEQDDGDHPDALLERAICGQLDVEDRATLERHLAGCPDCSAELEGSRILAASMAAGKQDEALNRRAVESALARLQEPERLGAKLRRWAGALQVRRPAIGFGLLGAAVVLAIGLVLHRAEPVSTPAGVSVEAAHTVVLADGSEVIPADAASAVQLAEQTPAGTTVRLRAGAAQFRIRHDHSRVFRVDAGAITIEDLGTVFRVAHQAGGAIQVTVTEGRVAVLYPASSFRVELGAGEDRVFSPVPPPLPVVAAPVEVPPAAGPVVVPIPRSQPRAHGGDDPAALLLAADVARRSHHPQAAATPLRRLLERYPRDPRAPSAAFTLGWVLLTDLGRAREAAAAFTEAERLAPRGALAEDAAARVAEAWQKAGDSRRAAQAARHYEQAYPTGRYLALMRGLVGEH